MTTKRHAAQSDSQSRSCQSAATGDTDKEATSEVNISLVAGTLASEPEERVLPSGTRAVSFSLTVRAAKAKTTSVPMVWFDPPKRIIQLSVGDRVVAVGSVVRRFYRSGGGLGSATEVVVANAAKVNTAASRRIIERVSASVEAVGARD